MNDNSSTVRSGSQLYQQEFSWLQQARDSLVHLTEATSPEVIDAYRQLLDHYERLLKDTVKVTDIGDVYLHKLAVSNEKIEEQRNNLAALVTQINTKNEELQAAYSRMELLSRTDPLTELSNRRDILEKIQQEISRFNRAGHSFCVLLIDIDDFKNINDSYGHELGDYILVASAKTMLGLVRRQDVVARWGGEEFLILLPETKQTDGAQVAEKLRASIADFPFKHRDVSARISVTIGVSSYQEVDDLDSCIRRADDALYSGKGQGKNCVCKADESDK